MSNLCDLDRPLCRDPSCVRADGVAKEVESEDGGLSSTPTFSSPDALLPHEFERRPQSYILFEGRGGEEDYVHVKSECCLSLCL